MQIAGSRVVTVDDVRAAARRLGLTNRPLCVHSSLRSFGWVDGGAAAILDALLAEGCTVLVPTFSWADYLVDPLPHQQPARNGAAHVQLRRHRPGDDHVYTPAAQALDRADMGAIPAAVLASPGRARGRHPLCSFGAVGPLAGALVAGQTPLRVFAPLEALAAAGGAIVLMGVGLNKMTPLHLAEQRAGRLMFRRWANGLAGAPIEVEVGGCSDGFPRLEPALSWLELRESVGASVWRAYPAAELLDAAALAIRTWPSITHCGRRDCECDDAVAGGPLLEARDPTG
jgi:aminoglycoside 3-N-acetyltransferase